MTWLTRLKSRLSQKEIQIIMLISLRWIGDFHPAIWKHRNVLGISIILPHLAAVMQPLISAVLINNVHLLLINALKVTPTSRKWLQICRSTYLLLTANAEDSQNKWLSNLSITKNLVVPSIKVNNSTYMQI